MENLLARDEMDSSRADSPLRPGDDAYMLNTNNMGLNEVVDNLIQLMDER